MFIWTEAGQFAPIDGRWAQNAARQSHRQLEMNVPIVLDGAVGRLAKLQSNTDTEWSMIVARPTHLLHILAQVPRSSEAGYWPHIETMLATWGWDD